MNKKSALILLLALLMSLALPLLVPSGALLYSQRTRLQEEVWALEDEVEGGLLDLLIPHARAEESPIAPLPEGFAPGFPLDPEGFSEAGYEDESISLTLETVNQDGVVYRIARVVIAHPSQLRTAVAAPDAMISSMADKNNAVIAINADYMAKDPDKTTFEYRMGKKIRARRNRMKDLLIIDQNADFHLFVKWDLDQIKAFEAEGHQIVNAFTFGPALVKDGELLTLDPDYGYNPKGDEPRMAIGQTMPLEYVLVLAEGRSEESRGVTHEELAAFMFDLGCMQAFNLDGGNSATMVFNGGYYQSHRTKANERAQSDMIFFASAVPR